MVVATLVTAAFGNDSSSAGGSVTVREHTATPAPTSAPLETPNDPGSTPQPTSTAALPPATEGDVTGFAWPIVGGCLPEQNSLMPGAPREYRDGVHEGVDFYDADNCAFVGVNSEVLAAKAGAVVRADWDYTDLTPDELAALDARIAAGDSSAPDIEDAFRGRQVWVDHGDGIITRYCHLNGIAEGIDVGVEVAQGELIAYVGESGTPESISNPGTEYHLHFEIRTGDFYLGEGLAPDGVRALYEQAFAP
jgi:murein DD-endopeptidase MepM/ murein hydrolase activator NlpD